VSLARVAQAVQADLEKVGIRVTIVDREAASMREAARSGKAEPALLDWLVRIRVLNVISVDAVFGMVGEPAASSTIARLRA